MIARFGVLNLILPCNLCSIIPNPTILKDLSALMASNNSKVRTILIQKCKWRELLQTVARADTAGACSVATNRGLLLLRVTTTQRAATTQCGYYLRVATTCT